MSLNRLLLGTGIGVISALTALSAASALAQDDAGGAAANWEAIANCATIDSPEPRHACMDDVLRRAGLLTPEREVAERRETFGQTPRKQEPEAKTQVAQPTTPPPPTKIDEVEGAVAYARFVGNGMLLVVTEEGAVWRQIDGEKMHFAPKAGTAFTAMAAAMGGYRCKIGRSTIYRCERLD